MEAQEISIESVKAVKETRNLVENSLVLAKLQRRISSGKTADILLPDADGTIYVRGQLGPYTGRNSELTEQLGEKSIPFVVNTARPGWDMRSDMDMVFNMKLPLPDAVIAGDGTMIYWRGPSGELQIDPAYFRKFLDHRVILKGAKKTEIGFDNEQIVDFLLPTLKNFAIGGREILLDVGPAGPSGEPGPGGIRFVVMQTPYETITKLNAEIRKQVFGVKLQLSEITELTDEDHFSGWLHLIPSFAGKDRATRYFLGNVSEHLGREVTGHVLGDTTVDIPLLAMGSGKSGEYVLMQYAVNNLPARTRQRLKRVEMALSNVHGTTNLKLLGSKGPDAVFEVVDNLP